ncbi:MAG: hypothetical protein LBT59_08260 [Clostridiales bacterium]|jgi:hypothetical protein|nr:hypothetical protein [Clostridiales bacterium]
MRYIRNLENFEEKINREVCEQAYAKYFADRGAVYTSTSEFLGTRFYISTGGEYGSDCEVHLYFEDNGDVTERDIFCACGRQNCEHLMMAALHTRDMYLGAYPSLLPIGYFEEEEPPGDLEKMVKRYVAGFEPSALECAKKIARSQKPYDVAIAMSFFMKSAISVSKKLTSKDIGVKTGILAISALGDEALKNKQYTDAASLQLIALNTLDTCQYLAWRHKYLARNEKEGVARKLSEILNKSRCVEDADGIARIDFASMSRKDAKKIALIISDSIYEAMQTDTILYLARAALPLCKDPDNRSELTRVLESFTIPFETYELKDARVAIGISGDDRETEMYLERFMDYDEYGEFKYADYLAEKNPPYALEYMRQAWIQSQVEPEKAWQWCGRLCNALEKAGYMRESCETRVELLGYQYFMKFKIDEKAFFEQFDRLKENSPKRDWPLFEAKILSEMLTNINNFFFSPYKEIYLKYLRKERKYKEFYEYLERYPMEFDECYNELHSIYGDRIHPLFEKFIIAQAASESTAKSYDKVCAYLKKYKDQGVNSEKYRLMLIDRFRSKKMLVAKLNDLQL